MKLSLKLLVTDSQRKLNPDRRRLYEKLKFKICIRSQLSPKKQNCFKGLNIIQIKSRIIFVITKCYIFKVGRIILLKKIYFNKYFTKLT